MEPAVYVVRVAGGSCVRIAAGGCVRVGRSPLGNDLVLDDPSVSRFHARLRWPFGSTLVVEDLGSANGTLVDGLFAERPVPVGERATLGVGEVELTVELERPGLLPDDGRLVTRLHGDLGSNQAGELTRARELSDLLLDLEREAARGVLHLERRGAWATLTLAAGRVVDASSGRESGEGALRPILDRFARARFRLVAEPAPRAPTLCVSPRALLAGSAGETLRLRAVTTAIAPLRRASA